MIYVKLDRHKALKGSSNLRPRWWEGPSQRELRHARNMAGLLFGLPRTGPVIQIKRETRTISGLPHAGALLEEPQTNRPSKRLGSTRP